MSIVKIASAEAPRIINKSLTDVLRGNSKLSKSLKLSLEYIKKVYLSSDLVRITYDEAYEIGLDEFDGRRQTIVGSYNALNAELRLLTEKRGSIARLNDKASLLVRLIGELFEFEESLMAEIEYPEFETHRAKHIRFLQALHQEFVRIQEGSADMYDLSYLIGSWLTDHLRTKDKAFGHFVHLTAQQMAQAAD